MNLASVKQLLRNVVVARPFPLEKPSVIQFPVIDICNSRCQMCKIWENKSSDDISVQELRTGLQSDLFSEVSSIGFNGGEPTLRKDLPELVQVAIENLPRLKSMSLITNAYKFKEVNDRVDRIAALAGENGKHFDLMVSLDGFGDVHDRVRGKPGNFERAKKVIDHARKNPNVHSLRIGCTVIRENVFHLPDLLDFCIENDLYIKFRQGVPHQRLYTENISEPYALTAQEQYEFVEFLEGLIAHYETGYMQNHFYRSLIDQIIHRAPRRAGCDWQHRGATITASGELAYCAVKSKSLMPNIATGDPAKAYFGGEEHLRQIIKYDCDDCHHDYVGIPGRSDSLKYLISRVLEKFKVKDRARRLPGFTALKTARSRKRYANSYRHYANLPETISLKTVSNGTSVKKVLICGWYGTETLGDKAILGGIVESLRSVLGSDVDISIASLNPYVTNMTQSQMPEFEDLVIFSVEEAIQSVPNQDLLVFGGGPLMAINDLAPMVVMFERARKAGVQTIAASVGVGPLGAPHLNHSIKSLLDLCDHRIYRDQNSRNIAASLGIDVSKDRVSEDPAFTWLRALPETGVKQAYGAGRKTLLLGLRDFPYREYANNLSLNEAQSLKDNYEASVISALERLVAADDQWIIQPLPMCTNHFGGDDRWFYRSLFRGNLKLKSFLDYSLLERELAPSEYVAAFQSADILLGMRFHSLVFGVELGVPSVAIDYTLGKGKVKALSEAFHLSCLKMDGLSPGKIYDAIQQCQSSDDLHAVQEVKELTFRSALGDALSRGVIA